MNDLAISEELQESIFIGLVPFEVICENLKKQFEDYINMEDENDYVDIFYTQLNASRQRLEELENDEFSNDTSKDMLETIHVKFINFLSKLFYERLNLTLITISSEEYDYDEIEYCFRYLYEVFILHAKSNFKIIIFNELKDSIDLDLDDSDYFDHIQLLVNDFTSVTMEPMAFLQLCSQEVYHMFEDGQVIGNFLKRYTPKLYQNEDFSVELISYITLSLEGYYE